MAANAAVAAAGVARSGRSKQDDGDGGAGSDHVHHLRVQRLLAVRQSGRSRSGQGGHHAHPRGRQAEPLVKASHVLAQVTDGRRVRLGLGERGNDHGLTAAVDPAVDERLDAVGYSYWPGV